MDSLQEWVEQIGGAAGALVAEDALEMREVPGAALSRRVGADGYPGVLPLWAGRRYVVGLLARPDAEPRVWPAVILKDGQGLTLATDARTLVPQLVVQRMLSGNPEGAERLAEQADRHGPAIAALHRALGGTDDSLRAVLDAVRDPAVRDSFRSPDANPAVYHGAHAALLRRIDGSESFTRYAHWLEGAIAGSPAAVNSLHLYGPWARRVLAWSIVMGRYDPAMPQPAPSLLHWLLEADAGIDAAVPGDPVWAVRVGSASGEATLALAAESLRDTPAPVDPVREGILRALLNEGEEYRGLAHAEAVVALDEGGEPARAWGVLLSAAWWAARNAGEVPAALGGGAAFLADRHGWSDIQWVLQLAAEG